MIPFSIDPGTGTLIGVVIAALAAAGGTVGASMMSKKAADRATGALQEVDQRKVDQATFEQVTKQWENIAKAAVARADAADDRAMSCDERAERLERRIDQLIQVMRDNNMTVPPPLPA